MKKLLILMVAVATAATSFAQYCGNSGPLICTPTGTMTQKGFSPDATQFPPFNNGQAVSASIQIKAPDTLTLIPGFYTTVDSFTIDSIVNLPAGICWATNKVSNTFGHFEQGCIVLSGTPCAYNGQYKMQMYVTYVTSGIGAGTFHSISDNIGYTYFTRVKNTTDAVTPVDTTQTNANPYIAYSSISSCLGPPLYFTPTLVSSDSVCDGGNVRIQIATNIPLSNSNYFKLRIHGNNGYSGYATHYSDSIHANTSGTYTFSLPDSIYNYNYGCSANLPYDLYFDATDTAIESYIEPLQIFGSAKMLNVPNTYVCQGNSITLGQGYICTQNYAWYQLPNTTTPINTTQTATLSPTVATQYRVTVSRSICTLDTTFTVSVQPNPVITVADTIVATCPNDSVTLVVVNPDPLAQYMWTCSCSVAQTYYQPTITVLPPYSIIYWLTATNIFGCSASQSVQVNIKQAPAQSLCMVTVDTSSTHNVVIWEKLDKGATDSFYIYREISTNNYMRIAAIPRDSLSEYDDTGANPNATSYRYKISVLDTCGNEGQQSQYHNSIHLQYLGTGNLSWNDYEIDSQTTPVLSYEVYRDSTGNGDWQPILNVSGTQNSATDPDFGLYPNAKYRVSANWAYTCISTRSIFSGVLSNSIRNQVSGVNAVSNDEAIEVVPNPAQNYISIILPKSPSGKLTLMNMTGNIISVAQTEGKEKETINIEALPVGVYILLYQDSNMSISKKITKD